MRNAVVAALGLAMAASAASGRMQTIDVAPNGMEQSAGPKSLLTLPAALRRAREIHRVSPDVVRIYLHGGFYNLDRPLVLTGEDSNLQIEAGRGEKPVWSGQTIIGGWKRSAANPNIWETQISDVKNGNWIFHELFLNGQRKGRTRVPERGFFRLPGLGVPNHPTELPVNSGEIRPEWARSGDSELVVYQAWAEARNQIRNVFASSNIVSLAGEALPNGSEKNARYFIENVPIEVRPGQWHLDPSTGLLSYWPEAGENMLKATVTAPHLYDLVQIQGEAEHPVRNVSFRGITFADTDWRLDGGTDTDPQAAVEVPAAVQARFATNCAFERCTFQRLGGYALELGRGCQDDKIIGNEMSDLGAGGIRAGEGDRKDATTFPCGHLLISDNHIHNIGLINAPGVGIFILQSSQNEIAHNEVDHTFYTAISVGWSWGYGETECRSNVIEFNHLHDIGQGMLSDMGAVYTLGLQPGGVVRNNLIHDVSIFGYGGWGLYTDEGSTGILLENNVVYHCQSAGLHQHYGRDNIIRNNIFAFNGEAQLARTRVEQYRAFTFTNNIVYFDSGLLFSGRWGDDLEMDCNIYYDARGGPAAGTTSEALRSWQKRGHDLHSFLVDPLFINPRKFDFRLRPQSPAVRAGFQPIDLSDIGVRAKYRHTESK